MDMFYLFKLNNVIVRVELSTLQITIKTNMTVKIIIAKVIQK